MDLFTATNQFFDLNHMNPDPMVPDTLSVLTTNTGAENLRRFRAIIANTRVMGVQPDTYRGTLYLPPGNYLIAAEASVFTNWHTNLAAHPGETDLRNIRLDGARFGASLLIREELTLWLAPGAVLVPEAGCIIDIASLLVAEDVLLFDLSRGGLVIFGNRVPVVRPEWWHLDTDTDHSTAIQRAIDAAIHNRVITWADSPAALTMTLAPLMVELRGRYQVGATVKVDGEKQSNDISRMLLSPNASNVNVIAPKASTAAVIAGYWSGRSRQGAALSATTSLGENPLLFLVFCPGLTIRNIAFETMLTGFQPCLELRLSTNFVAGVRYGSAQMTGVRGCRFKGRSTPLVQVGEREQITPGDDSAGRLPVAAPTFGGSDFSLLAFDECDFLPAGGVALDCGGLNTYPIRYRRCDFIGDADAMLSLWDGTQYIDGCYFENTRATIQPPLPYNSLQRGYELPDGADIFLRSSIPVLVLNRDGEYVLTASDLNYMPGLTAIGCVSRSARFLSTVRPSPRVHDRLDTAVVLINIRHMPSTTVAAPPIQWGLQNHQDHVFTTETIRSRRMGFGGPLVVIGGSFARPIVVLRGATQSAIVGARVPGAAFAVVLDEQLTTDVSGTLPLPLTYVFGLKVDQPDDFT